MPRPRGSDGHDNDLAARLAGDPLFADIDLAAALEPEGLAGRAAEQVDEFIHGAVRTALAACPARVAAADLEI